MNHCSPWRRRKSTDCQSHFRRVDIETASSFPSGETLYQSIVRRARGINHVGIDDDAGRIDIVERIHGDDERLLLGRLDS